ncbi:hypothetical protein D3C71_2004730 [compost metagenome]
MAEKSLGYREMEAGVATAPRAASVSSLDMELPGSVLVPELPIPKPMPMPIPLPMPLTCENTFPVSTLT